MRLILGVALILALAFAAIHARAQDWPKSVVFSGCGSSGAPPCHWVPLPGDTAATECPQDFAHGCVVHPVDGQERPSTTTTWPADAMTATQRTARTTSTLVCHSGDTITINREDGRTLLTAVCP